MIDSNLPKDAGLAGDVIADNYEGWSDEVLADFRANEFNCHVGSQLLLENDRVRVWEIRLDPGQRWHVHRHVLDYFWTAVTPGTSLQHTSDGTTRKVHYDAGHTRHYRFGAGEYLLHDIQNVGEAPLVFVTVEHLDSVNEPLPL